MKVPRLLKSAHSANTKATYSLGIDSFLSLLKHRSNVAHHVINPLYYHAFIYTKGFKASFLFLVCMMLMQEAEEQDTTCTAGPTCHTSHP